MKTAFQHIGFVSLKTAIPVSDGAFYHQNGMVFSNNVKYHYGGINSSHNRIGRLMLREDGSGAIEYYYGKMDEVLKTVRTLIVPNQAVATYVTQWKYDSHNRLLEMIYPDEEKVTYGYNLGGQLDHVRGYKSYGYDYVNKIGYDKFEQRTYLKYCNGAETFYSYDPARRRLQNLVVNAKAGTIMDNAYSYDAVSNVRGKAGGQMSHTYGYDALYRLASANGSYKGADGKTASYTLAMGYDNMHRITSKKQHLSQSGVQFDGTLNAGYDLTYTYQKGDGHKFQLGNVRDLNYRTEETPTDSATINNGHKYEYDANGNLVYINTSRMKNDGKEDEKAGEQKFRWDEENRLLATDQNGFVANYWYDADGERTVKSSGENEEIYVNSEFSGGRTNTAKFSLYVSPYLVASQGGRYTKHIYIGSQRIVSKLGDLASYGADPRRIPYAGNEADGITVDYKAKYVKQQQSIKDSYKDFGIAYNGEDNDDYVNGEGFCCNDGSLEAAHARLMAKTRVKADDNFHDKDAYEKMQFYYHPDHLGSSSYITNLDGEVAQHIEYVPFGEVFIEERNITWNTPYLFNAKEFDEETGMYYYGARYYESRLSLWISVDPISNYDPRNSENYLDGEHNLGVYFHYNLNPYSYCYLNPIVFYDPNGLQSKFWTRFWGGVQMVGGAVEVVGGATTALVTSETGVGIAGGIAIAANGIDNVQAGFRQMVSGETKQTALHQSTKYVARKVGASEDTAEKIARGADFATIFLGSTGSIKSLLKLSKTSKLSTFADIAMKGGQASKTKAGFKIVQEGGAKEAMKVYKKLIKAGYKSEKLEKGGYKLSKEGESIIFRSSKSGGYRNLDTFTKKEGNKNIDIFYK